MHGLFSGFERILLEGGFIIWILLLIAVMQIALAFANILQLRSDNFNYLAISEKEQLTKFSNLQKYQCALRVEVALTRGVATMKALIAVCPLFGLMGTVTGMIQIFDIVGSGLGVSPKLLSAGISHATMPTMVGMAISVLGLMLLNIWQKNIDMRKELLTR